MNRRVVIDTSVVVAGLRSNRGASFRLLSMVGQDRFQFCLSVPLVVEYEAATKSQSRALGLTHADIDEFLDYLCAVGESWRVHFLWRPVLKDPGEDSVLELAVEAGCDSIVTHNFSGFDDFIKDEYAPSPAKRAAHAMPEDRMSRVLSTLTRREEKIIRLRYGIDDGTPRTLEEVGTIFKVTRERVCQIEAKALRKLRHPSRSRKLTSYSKIIAAAAFGVHVLTPAQFLRQIGELS